MIRIKFVREVGRRRSLMSEPRTGFTKKKEEGETKDIPKL